MLVLASANWHPVIGIVAGRLRERYDRPVFVIALQPDGTGIGSGRSMPGVDLGRAVIAAVEAGIMPRRRPRDGGGATLRPASSARSAPI